MTTRPRAFAAVMGSPGSPVEDVQQLAETLRDAVDADGALTLHPVWTAVAAGEPADQVARVLAGVAAPMPLVPAWGRPTPVPRRGRLRRRGTRCSRFLKVSGHRFLAL